MKIKAKFKLSSILILSLGAVGFALLGFFFLKPIFNHRYIQIVDLSLFLFSAFIAIASLYYLLKNEVINIENNTLKKTSFFGIVQKEFLISELKTYTAIRKENKYLQWEDLDLYFNRGKARITSSNLNLDSYYKIKEHLISGIVENKKEKQKWENRNLRRFGIGFVIVWSLFILLFIQQDYNGNRIINSKSTIEISGKLVNQPKLKTGRRNKKSIEIELKEYPSFNFKLNGSELKALKTDEFFKNVNKEDGVSIKVWKDIYEKKISGTKQLLFSDKHFNYHQIDILGIIKNNKDFIPEKQVNKYRKKFHTKGNFYGLMAFAFFGIGVGIYLLILSIKAR